MSQIDLQKLLRRVLGQTGNDPSPAGCARQLGQLDAKAGERRRPAASLLTLLGVSLDDLFRTRKIREAYEAGYKAGDTRFEEEPGE